MARLRDAKGRTDGKSGYSRVLGDEELGNLISRVQGTVISAGTELDGGCSGIGQRLDLASVTARNALSARLKRQYRELGSWREVGLANGVSGAMAWRIANRDYETKDPEIRKVLGLPRVIIIHQGPKGRFVKRG